MFIKGASKEDHLLLTSLTKKSKAYWGFSIEQITLWDKELTISQEYIEQNDVFNLIEQNEIIGYYSNLKNNSEWILDNMFILPSEIGKGYGRLLMKHFLSFASKENTKKILLHSEPNVVGFYQKFGFQIVSEYESSIKGRFLKVMTKNL